MLRVVMSWKKLWNVSIIKLLNWNYFQMSKCRTDITSSFKLHHMFQKQHEKQESRIVCLYPTSSCRWFRFNTRKVKSKEISSMSAFTTNDVNRPVIQRSLIFEWLCQLEWLMSEHVIHGRCSVNVYFIDT